MENTLDSAQESQEYSTNNVGNTVANIKIHDQKGDVNEEKKQEEHVVVNKQKPAEIVVIPISNESSVAESQRKSLSKTGKLNLNPNQNASTPEYSRAVAFLVKNFLVLGLVVMILFGSLVPAPGVWFGETLPTFEVAVSFIFFISGIGLELTDVTKAVKGWKSTLYGSIAILFITPLLAFGVVAINFPMRFEFSLGLAVFINMPTTISTGVILTKQARGNIPLALFLTVVTNILSVFTIPFLLPWTLSTASVDITHIKLRPDGH